MLLICFVSSIAALIMKTGSNTIGENHCDLSLRCMNDSISVPVIRLAALKCIKKTSCPVLDNLSCAVNKVRKIQIHLKDIRIKQKKNDYWIQVKLTSYDDLIKQGNQSLFVKFSFEEGHTCYQFSIPLFFFTSSKDILLPCFRIQMLQRNYLRLFLSVHRETDEVISIQAMKYSLNNITDGQWLGGSVFKATYDFDDELIYFCLNTVQDLKCPFNNSIAIYKSYPDDVCSIKQAPIYSKTLPPDGRLNISREVLSLCQKYCIYVIFSKSQQCGALHPKYFIDVAFIQLPTAVSDTVPTTISSTISTSMAVDTDEFHTVIPEHDCEKWNFTIDVKVIEKNIIATVFLWPEYELCFSSYYMYLYKFSSPTCDPDCGHQTCKTFKFEAGPNNKEILKVYKNVDIGFYCILVVPFLNRSPVFEWTRDSGSFNVSETVASNNTKVDQRENDPKFPSKVIVAIAFLLFFTVFALWSCSEHIRRSKIKTDKVPEKSNEIEERESIPLLPLVVDTVYLFHPGDDDPVADKVLWLKQFLQEDAQFNVVTLRDVLPEYLKRPNRYISEMLSCDCSGTGPYCTSKKKFIVIISEKVLYDFHDSNHIWKFQEEKAFREVLEFVECTDWRKAYCHLFLVVFNESICIDHRFKSFLPTTTYGVAYVMPNGVLNLCTKLNPEISSHLPIENLSILLEQ
ncbi:hypothetical protein HNY73_017007 [Argiope bruennichi]|uniref:SEFIR domain-containing protein n=1 Tax=Argiope bruennichi TaxID=94029 RepID=A0A8T0ELJ7_ARGBR|nr:hypothetical protein HNY73_017007 [Argiope bruennichi]